MKKALKLLNKSSDYQVVHDPDKGLALRALRAFQPGEVVVTSPVVFCGEVTEPTLKHYVWHHPRSPEGCAMVMGDGQLLNHSNTPNTDWDWKGRAHIVKAIQPIEPGDELTLDYQWFDDPTAYDKVWQTQATEETASGTHRRMRQGDEWFCPKCGKRWGVNEDDPDCTPSSGSSSHRKGKEMAKDMDDKLVGKILKKARKMSIEELQQLLEHCESKVYAATDEDDDPCWDGYEMVGFKTKDGKRVPNCVVEETAATRQDLHYVLKNHGYIKQRTKYSELGPKVDVYHHPDGISKARVIHGAAAGLSKAEIWGGGHKFSFVSKEGLHNHLRQKHDKFLGASVYETASEKNTRRHQETAAPHNGMVHIDNAKKNDVETVWKHLGMDEFYNHPRLAGFHTEDHKMMRKHLKAFGVHYLKHTDKLGMMPHLPNGDRYRMHVHAPKNPQRGTKYYPRTKRSVEAFAEETAAPFDTSQYTWHTFKGERGRRLTHKNGKTTEVIRHGDKFGVRHSSNGKHARIITENGGPTKVFTVTHEHAHKLLAFSKRHRSETPQDKPYKRDAKIALSPVQQSRKHAMLSLHHYVNGNKDKAKKHRAKAEHHKVNFVKRTIERASGEELETAGRKLAQKGMLDGPPGTNKRSYKKFLRKMSMEDPKQNAWYHGYQHGFKKNAQPMSPFKPGKRHDHYMKGFHTGQQDYQENPYMHADTRYYA